MPTPAYMTIEGENQGNITADTFTEKSVGNIWQVGHESEILVQAFNHKVHTPTDPQSGQPTGQRVHGALVITKVFDKSSPLLYGAMTSGEKLTEVQIKWYRTSADGTQEHYFTHTLKDAVIVDITANMPNCQDPGQAHFTHLEDVSFRYLTIRWEHVVSSTDHEDSWRE
ncbi:MAG: Hcp family type VI secretion system effector [Thermodesulfovibrionia bacterium]|nr:Hcp family type VI secretion system effector [Thermodesulfovibrionia bacterium]